MKLTPSCLTILSIALAMLLTSLFAIAAPASKLIALTAEQEQAMGIRTAPLAKAGESFSQKIAAEVVIPLGQDRIISAPQAGLIDQLMVATGQQVRQGQAVAHLSSPELLALQREHLQALSQQKLTNNSYQRDSELYQDGIIAERRFLASQSQHQQTQALLEERRQALRLAGMSEHAIAEMEKSGQYSRGMILSAPSNGVVIEQMVTIGQRVDINTPLYRVAQLNPLWLEMHVPTSMLGQVKLQMPVQAILPNTGNTPSTIQGQIIAIVPNMNKQEQTVLVRALIKNPQANLNPGQLLEVEIIQNQTPSAQQFSVVKSAVVYMDANQPCVFVKQAKGYQLTPVKVIGDAGQALIIQADLPAQSMIAISATALLKAKAMQ